MLCLPRVFIMKLVGLDYFGLDTNNNVIKAIDLFATKYNLQLFCLYRFAYQDYSQA